MQVFALQGVYFKSATSGPTILVTTPDGRIDFSALGRKFGLDPTSIELDGRTFPMNLLESRSNWEQIKEFFERKGLPVGTEDDPVVVTGDTAGQVTQEQYDQKKAMDDVKMQLAELLNALASKKSIRVSDVGSIVWSDVQGSAGVIFEHVTDLFDAEKHTERNVRPFVWKERTESAQADQYLSHIRQELVQSSRKWSVINGNSSPDLLDNDDLGGMKFTGTVDVAVVVKVAHKLPATGLKVIFELKKVDKINRKAEYQTMISLLLANAVSDQYRPVAMLSDLVDQWIFFWIDDLSILRHEFATRSKAVGFLDAILEGDVDPEDHSHDIAALRRTGESSSRGVKRSFSGRQKFWPPEMERLEELAGFLPDDELRQDRAAIALQYALQTPALSSVVSDMRESSKPFFEEMYT